MVLLPKKLNTIKKDIESGKIDSAIKALKLLIEKNSSDYAAHKLLAYAYEKANNKQMAIVEYRFALRNSKHETLNEEKRIRYSLATLLLDINNIDEALNEFVLLVKIDPHNVDVLYKMGQIYYKKQDYENAARNLKMVVKNKQNFADAYHLLGLILYEAKDHKNALIEFTNNLKYAPRNYDSYFYIGKIYRGMRDYHRAMENFEVAIRNPELALKAILEKGLCAFEMNNIKLALGEFRKGLDNSYSENNIKLTIRYFYARCQEELRNYTSAIEQWEIIESKNHGFKDVKQKLNEYADLRQDDNLKDFMTSSPTDFQDLCVKIAGNTGLKVGEIQSDSNGIVTIYGHESNSKWRSSKPVSKIIKFRRDGEMIDEDEIRSLLEDMKKSNCLRGIYIHTGDYTHSAKQFAETRPIDLFSKEELKKYLKTATENN